MQHLHPAKLAASCRSAQCALPTMHCLVPLEPVTKGTDKRCRRHRYSRQQSRELCQATKAITAKTEDLQLSNRHQRPAARCVIIVPRDATSPLGKHEEVQWTEVMQHVAKRLANINPAFHADVYTDADIQAESRQASLLSALQGVDILLVAGIQNPKTASLLAQNTADVCTALFFDCAPQLEALTRLDGIQADSAWTKVFGKLWLTRSARVSKLLGTVKEFWSRETSDDLLFIFLVLIDSFVVEVETVRALRAQDLKSILCMVQNCRSQIVDCMSSPECRAALNCLQECAPNDQVCSYRCIASHETPQFEAFSLCILQKHNCLGLHVQIPPRPDPAPMSSFRAEPLTHEIAEQLFIGWLGEKDWSWRVAGGENAAYDQFPCQYQLYYRGRAKNTLWYDPVFQVRTYDGRTVWRRRHYRVRRAEVPGTFRFSVLDNGVTSNEFWRILDVTDDLSWGLFFYAGAASVVGQSYTGAVLMAPGEKDTFGKSYGHCSLEALIRFHKPYICRCTPDGSWPAESEQARIKAALARADIKTWELFRVDNCSCEGPPLGIPEKDSAANPVSGTLALART